MREIPPATLSWVSGRVGGRTRIISSSPMGTGTTVMHALDVLDDRGRVRRLAVRQYADAARFATDPWYRPEREALALEILEEAGVPAPRLVAADWDGTARPRPPTNVRPPWRRLMLSGTSSGSVAELRAERAGDVERVAGARPHLVAESWI